MSDQTSTIKIQIGSTADVAAFTAVRENAEALKSTLSGVKSVLESFGVSIGAFAIAEFGKSVLELGANIEHLAAQVDVSTQAFQVLSLTAQDFGVTSEEIAKAMEFMERSLSMAAQGASKQNQAIADLGLNTATLLAMTPDQQIQAIATAYENAADKGIAWSDVTALLGKNSAHLREVLEQLATQGMDALTKKNKDFIISDADLKALDQAEIKLHRLMVAAEVFGARFLAGHKAFEKTQAEEQDKKENPTPSAPSTPDPAAVAREQANIAATIEALPQVKAAHEALTKALQDESAATETLAQKSARLRAEAESDEAKANEPGKTNDASDVEARLKLKTEASRLRAEANKVDAQADKQRLDDAQKTADFIDKQEKLYSQIQNVGEKSKSDAEQLANAKAQELSLSQQISALDPRSVSDRQRILSLTEQELAAKKQIETTEIRMADERVKAIERASVAQNKFTDISLLAIENDWNKTDNEKWKEKRAMLSHAVADQEKLVAAQRVLANDKSLPSSSREKAGQKADDGQEEVNKRKQQLAGMAPAANSFTKQFSAGLTRLQNQWGTLQQNIAGGLTGTISSALNSVEQNMAQVIQGAISWKQALQNIAQTLESSVIQAIVKMFAEWIAQRIASATIGMAMSTEEGAVDAVAKAPGAALTSISSYGVAAAIGIAALVAAMAAFGGFEEGGHTGGVEGQPAGIVHGGEFVFSAPAVRNIGQDHLERAHEAAKRGPVGSSGGGSGGSNRPARQDRVVAFVDHASTRDRLMNDTTFENHLVGVMKRRRGEIYNM